METYQIFVVPMDITKIEEGKKFHSRAPVLKYQAREDLDDKEALEYSVAPSDNIEKIKEDLWHQVLK